MFDTLIVQTAFLGDLLLGIPLFKKLRELHPDGTLTVVCRKGLGSFLLETGLVDEVIEVDKSSRSGWREAKLRLKKRNFALILCPHQSPRSALFVRGLKAQKKVGFKSWFNAFLFDERIERPLDQPEVIRQLSLLANLSSDVRSGVGGFQKQQEKSGGRFNGGSLVPVPASFEMTLPLLAQLRSSRKNGDAWKKLVSPSLLSLMNEVDSETRKPLAVLAPGSVWATKMWTSDGFVAIGRELSTKGYSVLVTGSSQESDLCIEVTKKIPGARSLAGRTSLFESAQVLAMSEILICNDSGAMHLGACSGVPTVAVFGPTVLDFGYRPWNNRARVVEIDLDCRPCGTHGAKKCPLGTHACMENLAPGLVSAAIQEVLRTT